MKANINLYLIINNVRSAHNVGAMLRTAEGFAVKQVILCGYTPYPRLVNDQRPCHISAKVDAQIAKTALGAEHMLYWDHAADLPTAIQKIRHAEDVEVVSLELLPEAQTIERFKPTRSIALIVGNEVKGIEPDELKYCDKIIAIPMRGSKESFNVSVAAGIALFYLTLMV
ncbi:TrmH family RNA methyltransferase [Patescibacteria group bacterium]|jgi:tRNA G18 (ribose-2'-O)-methylase SpoU|nr:TrmH family RNA methyltransferase [Patescibacteria group bacterium]